MSRHARPDDTPDLADLSGATAKRLKTSHGPFNGNSLDTSSSPSASSSSSSSPSTPCANAAGVINGKTHEKGGALTNGRNGPMPTKSRTSEKAKGKTPILAVDPAKHFAADVFDHNHIAKLHTTYLANQPFKYALVEKLFNDELLKDVKDEILAELNFTEKETDIYKVRQTGDLASLNYLSPSQISLLPNLLKLRDALYSPKFRSFLQTVTGCGPLSGKKQDMSVNSYTKGCHLLNHDDVIGTRRVSYILYMPLPHYQLWQKEWGGALELYPVKEGEDGQLEPEAVPSKSIPPSWNQFIFFEVQPGRSFHSVEEVVIGGNMEDGRQRLSISGWFHATQEGEEGYMPEAVVPTVKSSREQLASTSTLFKSYPQSADESIADDLAELSSQHTDFLNEFLNPVYLQPRTMKALAERFARESSLQLHSFLTHELAEALEPRLRELDAVGGLGPQRAGGIPPHSAGVSSGAWTLKGPPHKWRYCVLKPHEAGGPTEAVLPRAAHKSSDEILRSLQDELFPSPAFRTWVARITTLFPMRHSSEARRFRPGLDYTLATSEDKEARLDVVLGLTPEVRGEVKEKSKKHKGQPVAMNTWQAEWGGWECYMAPHNEEDDPAVYRSGSSKKSKGDDARDAQSSQAPRSGLKGATDAAPKPNGTSSSKVQAEAEPDIGEEGPIEIDEEDHGEAPMDEEEEEGEDEEESTLLTVQPGFNRLLLVLRDDRVMRFVKYVSAAAEGSRWDVCGEYEVGMLQEDDEDEDAEGDDEAV